MTDTNLESLYQGILDRVLENDFHLPSMPDIAMKVRSAITSDVTTVDSLTQIISKDPGLTAYLIQAAASPVFRRAVAPKTLADVVGLLGFSSTSSMVMAYSTKNMVEIKDTTAKQLFQHTWDRLVVKTSVASFLAKQFKFHPVDQIQMAMLLTEVGSLSVLGAMLEHSDHINVDIYFQMCRQYSKKIGIAVLEKWELDEEIIELQRDCGQWDKTWADNLSMLDIANLALYYTVNLTVDTPTLPDLESLAAYEKIPENMKSCSKPNWLDLISDNNDEIQEIISAFR